MLSGGTDAKGKALRVGSGGWFLLVTPNEGGGPSQDPHSCVKAAGGGGGVSGWRCTQLGGLAGLGRAASVSQEETL